MFSWTIIINTSVVRYVTPPPSPLGVHVINEKFQIILYGSFKTTSQIYKCSFYLTINLVIVDNKNFFINKMNCWYDLHVTWSIWTVTFSTFTTKVQTLNSMLRTSASFRGTISFAVAVNNLQQFFLEQLADLFS